MNWLSTIKSWLRGHGRKARMAGAADSSDPQEALGGVKWVSEQDSPFGIEVLDCRPVATTMVSTTTDPNIAETFARLRSSRGEQHRERLPENAWRMSCDLTYPHVGEHKDGPIFIAPDMDHKWDIYLHDGHLFFSRSWTGELVFVAGIELEPPTARLASITSDADLWENDSTYVTAVVDYLVKSHLYKVVVPHPLPRDMSKGTAGQLALLSFSQYGRLGLYGTFGETTAFRVHRDTGGSYTVSGRRGSVDAKPAGESAVENHTALRAETA